MICLTDNDILLKLASFDLLSETLALLKIEPSDVYVLPSAKYKIKKDKKLLAKYGEGVGRALSFLESTIEINFKPDDKELLLLNNVRHETTGELLIHDGEQLLLTFSHPTEEVILATGDKVCLRALAKFPECSPFHQRFHGKVLCLEQTLLWLITHHGFDQVKQKVLPALRCDMAVQVAFGSGLSATRQMVERTLSEYVIELVQETSNILLKVLL